VRVVLNECDKENAVMSEFLLVSCIK